ncbi:MAG: hypothetical protein M3220_18695, partial [Chloroflexota bacterium]|nr:hypothetical protein [Chloroflexota bacterium]
GAHSVRPLSMVRSARAVWIVALVTLTLFLTFFAFRSWNILSFPHQVENGEGLVLDWSRQVAEGSLPYKPITSFPWNFSVYTPGYLATSALGLKLFPDMPWLGGRLISLLSALGLAGLLVAQMPLPSRRWSSASPTLLYGAVAAGLWLASPYLFRWATFYRPDMFALFWGALGVVLVQYAVRRDRALLLVPAALCFVASFWTKQSFIAAPLATILYLALVRRRWLPILGAVGAVGGGIMAIAFWQMTGRALFDNLILANANAYSWVAFWHFQRAFFTIVPILAGLALWALWQARGASGTAATSTWLYGLYLGLALLVTLSVGKAGAWENYFLETLWVLCALTGRGLLALTMVGGWGALAAPLLVLLQLAFYLQGFERLTPAAELAWLAEVQAESVAIRESLAALPVDATVWSEQTGVLTEVERPVPLFVFGYTQFEHQGIWDPTPLTNRLATGSEPLLIQRWDAIADPLGRDRWSRSMLDASERGYALGERAGRWLVRPPQPFPPPDEPSLLDESLSLVDWMAVGERCCADCASQGVEPCPHDVIRLPAELQPGQSLSIHLLWRSEKLEERPLSSSVQLFAPDGTRVVQDDAPLRGAGLGGAWPADALVRDEHVLQLPDELPAGAYSLLVTLYESESGAPRGSVTIRQFKVRPQPPERSLPIWRDVMFDNTLRLLSRDPLPPSLAPGETLALRTQWESKQPVPSALTAFLHLVAPDGTLAGQVDFVPAYPPMLWSPGERVELIYSLPLPDTLPRGTYEALLGWYDATALERIPAQDENVLDGALRLGTVTVNN